MVADLVMSNMTSVDVRSFFATMGAFPTGVAVVTTKTPDEELHGLTCNAFSSVSADPPLILICVDRQSRTLPALKSSGRFAVNFIAAGHERVSNLFASKATEKFDDVYWEPASNGMPVLTHDAIAYASCKIEEWVSAGDHLVIIGLVEDVQPPSPEKEPLVYFRKQYGIVQFPTTS